MRKYEFNAWIVINEMIICINLHKLFELFQRG